MAVQSVAVACIPSHFVECRLPADCGQLVHQCGSLSIILWQSQSVIACTKVEIIYHSLMMD